MGLISNEEDFDEYIIEFNEQKKQWELNKVGASRAVRVADSLYSSNLESEARRIARNNAPSYLQIRTRRGGLKTSTEYPG